MTKRQLIELLQRCPDDDAEVFIPPGTVERTPSGGFGMHRVNVVSTTSWTPPGGNGPVSCIALSRDKLPVPDEPEVLN